MKQKRIAIFLGHPAHFYLFRNMADNLTKRGVSILFLVKRKDILEELVKEAGYDYVVVRKVERKKSSKFALLYSVLTMEYKILKALFKNNIRVLIGTWGFIEPLFGIKVITCNEDDAQAVPLFAKMAYPFASVILCPTVCDCGKWNSKAVKYQSYQELAYLHPNHFTPSKDVLKRYGIDAEKSYFVLRFASLHAHHDKGIKGIDTAIAEKLIGMLRPYGEIYITSERKLEPQFEQYRIKINPIDMHHVMAFASLYVGDSQTMAAEAGVLGTPFVRFNDFVGRLSYLNEIERTYHLGFGHKTDDVEGLYESVQKWLDMPDRKAVCADYRHKMLSEKIDCAQFLTQYVEGVLR